MRHNRMPLILDNDVPIEFDPIGAPETGALRNSGIEILGSVPWGTHFCQFYATSTDLVETLVPYFKAGLEGNEYCMWITSAPLHVEQAIAALRASAPELDQNISSGQIEILDYSQWYTPSGRFDADAVLRGWTEKLDAAIARGYDGLRLTGNTFWLERSDWYNFTRYEEKVNEVIGRQRMIALCTYSLEKCGAREIMDVISNHQFALIKSTGHWEIIESATHRKMEQALRESEERLRLAVWAADLGVYEWDILRDHAVWENQRMYEIFGRSPEFGPLSKKMFMEQVIYPQDAEAFEAAVNAGLEPDRLFHVICRVKRFNDGELRWVEFHGRFGRDSAGTPLFLSGVLEDITERIQYEEKLKDYAQQLEHLNHELQDFTKIASHDLKEPLRKISSFGLYLKERASSKLEKNEQDYLERMINGAARLQTMVDKLLDYSRITTRIEPLSQVDLTRVIADVIADLEPRLDTSHGKVEVGQLPVINADPLQMHQLLENLISNALKFHKPGLAPIVRIESKQITGGRVDIVVADQGIGFPMEQAETLFQPFHRLVGRSEYEGTGMGLAICRKIVERHQGTVSVQSTPGEGTTFTVTLPIHQSGK